jgi:hypothetical protein
MSSGVNWLHPLMLHRPKVLLEKCGTRKWARGARQLSEARESAGQHIQKYNHDQAHREAVIVALKMRDLWVRFLRSRGEARVGT